MTERYAHSKIYKLVNDVDDEIYVGSTCMPLRKRLNSHRRCARSKPRLPAYDHLDEIGWDNVHIVLLKEYNLENKEEILAKERHWYDKLKPELNRYRPRVSQEERVEERREYDAAYYETNADKIKERGREYHAANADRRNDYLRRYRRQRLVCECGGSYLERTKDRHLKTKKHLSFE